MPGTKEGYRKWRANMVEQLGGEAAFAEWRRKNAAKGGKNANPDNPGNFKNNPELARRAGSVKRTTTDQPQAVRDSQYKDERTKELQ